MKVGVIPSTRQSPFILFQFVLVQWLAKRAGEHHGSAAGNGGARKTETTTHPHLNLPFAEALLFWYVQFQNYDVVMVFNRARGHVHKSRVSAARAAAQKASALANAAGATGGGGENFAFQVK